MILTNGTIRTMDRQQPMVDRLVVEESEIRFRPSVGSRHTWVDLKGRCVVPGFTDSHTHFPTWAMLSNWLSLEQCTSVAEMLELVASAAVDSHPRRWLVGYGWPNAFLTRIRVLPRVLLDSATGRVPTALWSKDMHTFWLNSSGLESASLSVQSYSADVEVDESGEPTGILRESAAWRFREASLAWSTDQYADAVARAIPTAHARGITAVHDKDGWIGAPAIWAKVRERGELTLRVWQSIPPEEMRASDELRANSVKGDFLRLGYLKVFVDGSLGSGTALMLSGGGTTTTGYDDLRTLIEEATSAGWPVAIHAIGDKGNRIALDALEATRSAWQPRGIRQRIEHAQHLHPDDIHRFATLGVVASVQFADGVLSREAVAALPPAVAEGSFAFRKLWDSGTILVNGSDAPLTELDPLVGIRAAATRTLDHREPFHPHEALPVIAALEASTVLPAWLAEEEGIRGRLVPGQAADLVVLDRDPVTCPLDELADLTVVATMVAGSWVHNPPPWD